MKHAILTIGFHRSGTSALTGFISKFGAYPGNDLIPPSKENEKGFYENMRIYQANEFILKEYFNSTWDNIDQEKIRSTDYNAQIDAILKLAISCCYGEAQTIIIKDPRICVLIPHYKRILEDMGYEVSLIGTYRATYEILQSIKHQYNIDEEKSFHQLILYNTLFLSEYNIKNIEFNDLLKNPDSVISILEKELPFLDYNINNKNIAKEFISKDLKHF